MGFNKSDEIEYRLVRADEALLAAKSNIDAGAWNSSMNRIYYAAFYAVLALLLSKGIAAKTHNGVRRMFDLHFVKTNIVTKKSARFYSNLLGWRTEVDYAAHIDYDEETVVPLLQEVIDFIEEIKSKIKVS